MYTIKEKDSGKILELFNEETDKGVNLYLQEEDKDFLIKLIANLLKN